ncbi:glutathione-regulated potassium-efflux system protein KefB [Rhodanobacter sp. FW510-R12]|uniref:monovalent cation:proton antiporter-2 (CPA2) family protein n=1 Tax=unclassified Rhodanobacter TaxID=2621553 RepID=UPI0007A9F822|nr:MULTISPECIES: monovalent cation:proton antiporter-2 (CPA2) family protein [unclassified Rhodanobacter]KZC18051.1 glutathione-regulated potassium-efflux system protein KefB [Rhodanobacter sp. FW104-R8]KZC28235.1 glutathione-regulated potassium-efflux system protein KefB [Rhodanobacter sp. FW510-T8]KZC33401.1 glutathione-regulated potassium-efflux system protein KefB [Rhodanobacter sp. FW510-R10]
MDSHHFLQTAVVFLLATVIAVPLTKRFRLGAVLGYLIAGVAIGPQLLGLVSDTAGVAAISEFGVVLMLFVIGMELSPQRLWVMRRAVFGMGLLQVLSCSVAIGAAAYFLFGLPGKGAAVVGGSLALSSTAFGLQILAERKEAGSAYGRQVFAILLFQDLAAIPLIAAVPLLASAAGAQSFDLVALLRTTGVIVAVVVGGRYLLRPVFRFVARADSVEVFTATALLVVMGVALLMEMAGVSATLGAFLAGVLLADSEYRHEIESNIEPFKGLLLGLFFISVGMSMDISLLLHRPGLLLGLVAALLLLKSVLLWPLGRLLGGLNRSDTLRLVVLLACGGEFAFVVLKQAAEQRLVGTAQHDVLVLALTLTMALTPLLVVLAAKALNVKPKKPVREFDTIEADTPRVIIAGFGRVGQIIARVLRAQGIPFVALEHSAEQVDQSRRFGNINLFFGDPARPELLRAAQAERAEVFVLATDDPEANLRTARLVRRQYPHLKIIARARNRQHVFRLMDMGVEEPIRETFHSSLKMTRKTLEALGLPHELAADRVERFRRYDEDLLKKQALVYDDETKLMQSTREAMIDLQRLFEADAERSAERERQRDAGVPLADGD